jgi:hypothetical protein
VNRRQLVLGLIVLLVVLAAIAAGFALGRIGGDDASDGGSKAVTVTGTGTVKAVPDVARVTVGVTATAKTAGGARSAADARMTRVLATVKAHGVEPPDIQTSDVSLYPTYNRDGSRIVGFKATNSVTVTVRDLDEAGPILTASAAAGANDVGGPTLTVSDEKLVYQRALKAAVADARSHAEAIAEASGETVGALRTASEASENAPEPYAADAMAQKALPRTPIRPGTLEVTANVTATFDLE